MINSLFLRASLYAVLMAAALASTGCVQEQSRTLAVTPTTVSTVAYSGPKTPLSIGRFDNRTSYLKGVFSDGQDRLGNQAQTILSTHLQQTNRFAMLDRNNLTALKQEAALAGSTQALKGAEYVVTGDVTEFGRKDVGDRQLFGILGRGKSQIAYAKVSLQLVNTTTSEVAFSTQGAGEYSLSTREVIGFGGTAGYDSTLNGKVLDLAIREAVQNLGQAMDSGAWKP
jgi:curli biogenesis system outer membrane secretion channel CsgG